MEGGEMHCHLASNDNVQRDGNTYHDNYDPKNRIIDSKFANKKINQIRKR
jgi:hypothetical protein